MPAALRVPLPDESKQFVDKDTYEVVCLQRRGQDQVQHNVMHLAAPVVEELRLCSHGASGLGHHGLEPPPPLQNQSPSLPCQVFEGRCDGGWVLIWMHGLSMWQLQTEPGGGHVRRVMSFFAKACDSKGKSWRRDWLKCHWKANTALLPSFCSNLRRIYRLYEEMAVRTPLMGMVASL